jgi:hypothetical protein
MAKYHINSRGEAGLCRAQVSNCPFGGESDHYQSAPEARLGYEEKMKSLSEQKISKAFIENVDHRTRLFSEDSIMNVIDEMRRERPVDFPEWTGDQASHQTVMNMGVRILMDQVQEAMDRDSETPYSDALTKLRNITANGNRELRRD